MVVLLKDILKYISHLCGRSLTTYVDIFQILTTYLVTYPWLTLVKEFLLLLSRENLRTTDSSSTTNLPTRLVNVVCE